VLRLGVPVYGLLLVGAQPRNGVEQGQRRTTWLSPTLPTISYLYLLYPTLLLPTYLKPYSTRLPTACLLLCLFDSHIFILHKCILYLHSTLAQTQPCFIGWSPARAAKGPVNHAIFIH
jgi:hypothetical protein